MMAYGKRGTFMKDEKSYYSIGEAAKAAGMTEETLRHYDRVGLVKPSKRDEWTNYRYYTEQDVVRLNTVYALRQMELPLKKIKEVLAYDDLRENRRFSDRGGANRRQKDRRAAIQQIENTGGEAGLCAQAANRAAHGAGFRPTAAGARDYAFRRGGKAGFGRFMELSRPFLQPNRAVPTGTVRI